MCESIVLTVFFFFFSSRARNDRVSGSSFLLSFGPKTTWIGPCFPFAFSFPLFSLESLEVSKVRG